MARRAPRRQVTKTRSPETLESRVVMSADPLLSLHGSLSMLDDVPAMTTHSAPALDYSLVQGALVETAPGYDPDADFWAGDGLFNETQDDLGQRIEQTLYEANQQTGQDDVLAKYGFTGVGQTVAVIDTGIAYSHNALGGGVGANYKVVGGWDFTENDANFYDDQGPKSAHGTHVAGIIGAQGAGNHSGVSTGVDLVGLRVFDDAGNGYFHWVEQALQWTYDNRNSYANPITAVNLSLGTEWNSMSNPAWAMLENEFAQLESVGIFISVSAGNSFTNYNTKGLSYPAASDHVVPVMAIDGNGQLSYFSQRAENAIAAPGRYITSTVPDYAANDADTIDDDWLSMSGTSMAAPYVAGASVLIRQAMEFVGQTGIDQWDIYNHMMATADTFYDSATSTNFKRLNLFAAIDALMPADDFTSSQVDAYNLGTINDSGATPLANLSGVISTLDDADTFKFVAGASGTVTISATQSHELAAQWNVWGANSWTVNQAGECVIDVVAGQTYTFSLATSDGLGYYDLSVDLEASFAAVEWGSIGPQETRTGLSVNGETWYQVTAGRTGYFTAETIAQSGAATVAIYDAQMGALAADGTRADVQVTAGETLYLRLTGNSADYNLRMTNALTVSGGVATLVGTGGDDSLSFSAGGGSHSVSLNSVTYTIASSHAGAFQLDGGVGGYDRVDLNGGVGDDAATLNSAGGSISGAGYSASSSNIDYTVVTGGGGNDQAVLYDSAGDDQLVADPTKVELRGVGYRNRAEGFSRVLSYATLGGYDTAVFHDSAGNDLYRAWDNRALMVGAGFYNYALGYDRIDAYASTGADRAELFGGAGDDAFLAWSTHAVMQSSLSYSYARGFDETIGYATGGNDQAVLYDSAGDDQLVADPTKVELRGVGYRNRAEGFSRVLSYATLGGYDTAVFHDSAGNDLYRAWDNRALMVGAGFYNYALGYDRIDAYASTGADRAELFGGAGDDAFLAWSTHAVMQSSLSYSYARGFDETIGYATGGNDQAVLYDSAGDDQLVADPTKVELRGVGYRNRAEGFSRVLSYATLGGYDTAVFHDSAGNDLYRAWDNRALMVGAGFYNYALGYDRTQAYSTSGSDRADLYGGAGDDVFSALGADATLLRDDYYHAASGFNAVTAHLDGGGDDTVNVGVTDFAFATLGGGS